MRRPPSPGAAVRPGPLAWAVVAAWLLLTGMAMWWLNPIGITDLFELCRSRSVG